MSVVLSGEPQTRHDTTSVLEFETAHIHNQNVGEFFTHAIQGNDLVCVSASGLVAGFTYEVGVLADARAQFKRDCALQPQETSSTVLAELADT